MKSKPGTSSPAAGGGPATPGASSAGASAAAGADSSAAAGADSRGRLPAAPAPCFTRPNYLRLWLACARYSVVRAMMFRMDFLMWTLVEFLRPLALARLLWLRSLRCHTAVGG